jgi:uncharacterized secreted protein with C-terminal beta-propeller domain
MNIKKILSIGVIGGLFTVLVGGAGVNAAAVTQFSDVDSVHPNSDAIYYLQENEVVDGYKDGSYKPGANINRAEFLKILMEAAGYEEEGTDCYTDVMGGWFAPYICKAAELGFIEGYEDGSFKPGSEINFAEASKMIANIMGLELDESYDENWFQGFVKSLEGLQAIPATVVDFDKTLMRSEMSDMIWRIETENVYELANTYEGIQAGESASGGLRSFSSCDDLRAYMDSNTQNYYFYDDVLEETDDVMEMSAPAAEKSSSDSVDLGSGADGGVEYSTTNVQVEGVDEADVVKNDSEYIYLLKDETVRIVRAYSPTELREIAVIEIENSDFAPNEMYVDGDQLVVIGSAYTDMGHFVDKVVRDYYGELTEVYIYDISDRSNPDLERQIAFEGYYSTSRKVDDMLYVITNKSAYYGVDWLEADDDELVPLYADSADDEVKVASMCSDVYYMPSVESTSYMVVGSVSLDSPKSDVEVEVVVGWGGNVYASRDNLYIAEQYYSPVLWDNWGGGWSDEETIVHKFSLGLGNLSYLGSSVVDGRTLNQFSMDEHDGYFRVATTKGRSWDDNSENNLYVMDSDLNVVGKVEGLAKGEEIYSARFIGDRAYMVTFKTIDPLFVIDVSDPTNPYVLGELKIPGVSDYLHPYDEDHLIGFGLDTETLSEGEQAEMGEGFAWYQGVKVAMFDVSDVRNPKELHKVVIGDRGTYSELSWNHKALLFDKAKGLMAFPITVAEIPQTVKDFGVDSWAYGDYVFQGAYIYDVSVDNGFELRGTVTHYDNFDAEYNYGWDYTKWVDRILYIGNHFYTTSDAKVMSHTMSDVSEVGELELE